MSLVPMLFSSWWEHLDRPHRIFDQNFALTLSPEDLPRPSDLFLEDDDFVLLRPRRRGNRRYRPYDRSLSQKSSGKSTIRSNKDNFQVTLDVQHFAPEQITVKAVGRHVVVEGKHEEKQDEHGWVSRQFVRKYLVPDQCDINELKTVLSSDGVLTISAPRKQIQSNENERIIQIERTGRPALRDEGSESSDTSQENSGVQKNPGPQRSSDKTVKAA